MADAGLSVSFFILHTATLCVCVCVSVCVCVCVCARARANLFSTSDGSLAGTSSAEYNYESFTKTIRTGARSFLTVPQSAVWIVRTRGVGTQNEKRAS